MIKLFLNQIQKFVDYNNLLYDYSKFTFKSNFKFDNFKTRNRHYVDGFFILQDICNFLGEDNEILKCKSNSVCKDSYYSDQQFNFSIDINEKTTEQELEKLIIKFFSITDLNNEFPNLCKNYKKKCGMLQEKLNELKLNDKDKIEINWDYLRSLI